MVTIALESRRTPPTSPLTGWIFRGTKLGLNHRPEFPVESRSYRWPELFSGGVGSNQRDSGCYSVANASRRSRWYSASFALAEVMVSSSSAILAKSFPGTTT